MLQMLTILSFCKLFAKLFNCENKSFKNIIIWFALDHNPLILKRRFLQFQIQKIERLEHFNI